jgi:hypothetical protein
MRSVVTISLLVYIHRLAAVATALGTAKEIAAAMRANVSLVLFIHPLLGAQLTPGGNSPHNHPLAHRKGEIVYVFARKVVALVTAFIAFFLAAGLDIALFAQEPGVARQTAPAMDILYLHSVDGGQLLLELLVIVPGGDVHSTDTAV